MAKQLSKSESTLRQVQQARRELKRTHEEESHKKDLQIQTLTNQVANKHAGASLHSRSDTSNQELELTRRTRQDDGWFSFCGC